jgi:hypothetical protein
LAKTIGRDGRARRLHMNSAAPKRPKQTEVMLTELHHLAGHCREIAPDKFLPGLASETRRQEALGSMRIVGGWIEEILPAEPWQEGKMPPEKAG